MNNPYDNPAMAAFKMSSFKIPKKMDSRTGPPSATKKLYHKSTSQLGRPPKHQARLPREKDPTYMPFKSASSVSSGSMNYVDPNKSRKQDRSYEDLYDNVELEQQFILRLPTAAAASLNAALESEAPNIKDRLGIEFKSDLKKANVKWDGYIYPARFQNLPCVVESYKTVDNKNLYKTADLSGVLNCRTQDDFSPAASDDEGATPEEIAKKKEKLEKKLYNLNHGLTPPLKNVRKRRFRKVLKKKYETAPEIEKEVRRLFRMDNEAFSVNWEVIPEGDPNRASSSGDKKVDQGGSSAVPAVQMEDIFGSQVSSSESEEEEEEESKNRAKSMENLVASLEAGTLDEASSSASQQPEAVSGPPASDSSQAAETAVDGLVSAEELQESLRARDRMDTLRRELEEVRRRRRKQEAEIEGLENPILRGRFMADLKALQDEEAAKEAECQELAVQLGDY